MAHLAVRGGKRTVLDGLQKPYPVLSQADREAVMGVLERGILWGQHAPEVSALEREWADYVGTRYCIATNSGTAALHAAVAAAGVGPGDEVITSAHSFLASASAVLHHNGIPVFVDIDPATYNIDASQIESAITDRTKAIMPVHIHGLPADMDQILEVAKRHSLMVIEDACQAHGATYGGKKVGGIGHIAAFSLNHTKNLAGGEGGLITTDDLDLRDGADMLHVFGEMLRKDQPRAYHAYTMGWNYRTQEMAAALTRSRLRVLDEENALRVQNAEFLSQQLAAIPGLVPPISPADRTHVYHLYRVRFLPDVLGVDNKGQEFTQALIQALNAEGVAVGQWQGQPLPAQALFQERRGYGKGCPWACPLAAEPGTNLQENYDPDRYPLTKELLANSLVMGEAISPPNGRELMSYYAEAFNKVFAHLDEALA